jgi:hypothetical protein
MSPIHLCMYSHQPSATTQPGKPSCILTLRGYPDYMIEIHLISPCFACFSRSLEVHNDYTPRTTKVIKAATLSKTDKHKEKSE